MSIPFGLRIASAITSLVALTHSVIAVDGVQHWNVRQAPVGVSGDLEGVAYGNNTWVVIGENGLILSSPDGITWTPETNPTAPAGLSDIAFGNGVFVAVGTGGAVVTSPDGHQWSKRTSGFSGAFEIIHDGTRFMTIVAGGYLHTSADGIHWNLVKQVPVKYDIGGFAYGNGVYVEAGYKRTGQPADLFVSANLTNWTKCDAKLAQNFHNVGFGLGLFVAVGQGGAIITSTDGVEWTPRPSAHSGFIWDLATDGRHFAAAAQWGRILTSSDGIDWTVHETDLPWHLTDIVFGKDTFVAVGWEGQIVQSDPVDTAQPAGIRIQQPAKASNSFSFSFTADVGHSYQVQASPDLKAWAPLDTLTATSTPMSYTDPATPGGPRYYRVFKP